MKKRIAGFTLIEVLVTVSFICLLAGGFTYFAKSSSHWFTESLARAQSHYKVCEKLEELRANPFPLSNKAFDNGRGSITIIPITYDLAEIRVAYIWKEGRKPLEVCTLRSKYP